MDIKVLYPPPKQEKGIEYKSNEVIINTNIPLTINKYTDLWWKNKKCF